MEQPDGSYAGIAADFVRLAARLEGKADPGGLLLSSETYALVQDIVVAEEREVLTVKGIRRSITPYAVIALKDDTQKNRIDFSRNGVELHIDVDALNESDRSEVSEKLKIIADKLSN